MNILQNIFRDHYEELIYITHPRPSVIENVDKMINCGDPSFGGAMYGCSKCGESDKHLYRAISKEKHKILLSFNRWRTSILSSFGYDPLKCPCCGQEMLILDIYYNHKRVSLQELYERTIRNSRYKPPSTTHSRSVIKCSKKIGA